MASKKKKTAAKTAPKKKAAAKKAAKKAPAKKAAKKAPAKKKAAPAKKKAAPAKKKAAPAKKAKKKAAAPSSSASSAAPASTIVKKPAGATKKPQKKQKPAKAEAERHVGFVTTSEALDTHVVPLPSKKSLDLSSLAASYQGGDATAHAVTTEQMDEMADVGLRADGEIVQVEEDADVAPCRLVDHGEGRFSLCLDDFKMPEVALFAERGLQGGGYTWEAIADSLLRLRRPDLADQIAWDSEAGMFVAVGNRPNLVLLAKLIQEAMTSPEVLAQAVDAADPDRLE